MQYGSCAESEDGSETADLGRDASTIREAGQAAGVRLVRLGCSPLVCGDEPKADKLAKKTTRITIETHQIWVLHKGINTVRRWCSGCRAEVDWAAPESAGVLAGLPPSTVEKWLDSGELHSRQAEHGSRLVCLNSLRRSVPRQEDR